MENRPYFIAADVASNLGIALLATAISTLIFGGNIGMLAGMVGGMLIGMTIGMLIGFGVLARLFGIMEVLIPCMMSGMIGGMIGGMQDLSVGEILQWGCVAGLGSLVAIYTLNAVFGGPQKIDPPQSETH
jgi:hypothetical protein